MAAPLGVLFNFDWVLCLCLSPGFCISVLKGRLAPCHSHIGVNRNAPVHRITSVSP